MELQGKVIRGWRAWANLIRVPNLLTVPGDVLAGFILAGQEGGGDAGDVLVALVAGLCLYAAGLVMNDLVDLEVDRRERPARSIASGAVSQTVARLCVVALLTVSLVLLGSRGAWLLATGIAIGLLVFVYNFYARRSRLAAALVMGLCRAGLVWLGAAAAFRGGQINPDVIFAPVMWMLFIGSVSWLASREMNPHPYGIERWLPSALVTAGLISTVWWLNPINQQAMFRGILCFLFAVMLTFQAGSSLGAPVIRRTSSRRFRRVDTTTMYPRAIGMLISALIPMQAGLLVYTSSEPWVLLASLLLLFCWPLNRLLAKYFSPS